MIREYTLFQARFVNQQLLRENFFTSFGDFSVITAQKLLQTGWKTFPFDALVDGGLLASKWMTMCYKRHLDLFMGESDIENPQMSIRLSLNLAIYQ